MREEGKNKSGKIREKGGGGRRKNCIRKERNVLILHPTLLSCAGSSATSSQLRTRNWSLHFRTRK